MAVRPEELEFWLPSEFLTDEDILMDSNFRGSEPVSSPFRLQIPGSQLCNGSTLSSPVESVVGSTETESDEDVALLSELTRQLTLLDGHRFAPTRPTHEKKWVQSGSPQSTLLHVESFSGRSTSTGSSNGSPNGPSQVSSPPTTPLSRNNNYWDLIYGGAVVEGLKSNTAGGLTSSNTSGIFQRQGAFSNFPPPKPAVHPAIYPNYLVQGKELFGRKGCGLQGGQLINGPNTTTGHNMGGWVRSSGVLPCGCRGIPFGNKNYPQLQLGSGARGCGFHLGGVGYGVGHGPGCGSVSRVVGGVGGPVKSERVGTGVFLPRRYDEKSSTTSPCSTVDSRKKSGYSSGWSTKKAPVINKNITSKTALTTKCPPEKFGCDTITDYNALLARKVPISSTIQKTTPFPEPAINHELCLPQEWTY